MNETERVRVLSIDDHPLVREGIAAMINDQPDMHMVSQGASGKEAIQRFREHQPDVVLMDVRLPDMSGIDAMITIRSEFPNARIIIITSCTSCEGETVKVHIKHIMEKLGANERTEAVTIAVRRGIIHL